MKEVSGEEVLKFVSDYNSSIQVVILSAQSEIKKAIECIKMGAYDYIAKPYNFDELVLTINRALEHKDLLVKTTISNQVSRKLSII
jgi:DNA-binding NtrC family response regulator